jgi:hypothetical protein
MKLKLKDKTVNLNGLDFRILQALMVVATIWRRHGMLEVTITSALDGEHGVGSLHCFGRAVDIRSRNLPDVFKMCDSLRDCISEEYDVIVEADHIHIEFDPKT